MKPIITDLLNKGKENAININDLAIHFPEASQRNLREQIERERKQGNPILAKKNDGGGYYLPKSEEEILEYLELLNHSIQSLQDVYTAIKSHLTGEKEKAPASYTG